MFVSIVNFSGHEIKIIVIVLLLLLLKRSFKMSRIDTPNCLIMQVFKESLKQKV